MKDHTKLKKLNDEELYKVAGGDGGGEVRVITGPPPLPERA